MVVAVVANAAASAAVRARRRARRRRLPAARRAPGAGVEDARKRGLQLLGTAHLSAAACPLLPLLTRIARHRSKYLVTIRAPRFGLIRETGWRSIAPPRLRVL